MAYNVTIEKQLFSRVCFQLTYFYSSSNIVTTQYNIETNQTVVYQDRVIPECKYYLNKSKDHRGFYTGIYTELTLQHNIYNSSSAPFSTPYYTVPGDDYYSEYYDMAFGGGIIGGFQTYFHRRIVLDFLLGIGIRKYFNVVNLYSANNPTPSVNTSPDPDGRLALNIGYKF